MTTTDRLLAAARADLGYRERADGTTKHGSWYVRNKPAPEVFASAPWCQMGVSFWANEARIPQDVIPRMAYTPWAADWFRDRGLFTQTPRPGDIVWFDWAGSKNIAAIDHVGLVEAVLADGRVVTIEANTGNAVRRHTRSRECIAGFGRWKRATSKPASKPKPKPAPNPTEAAVKRLPTLKQGDKGWHVKTLHYLLIARDYAGLDGVDDTVFTPAHTAGVRGLQDAAGLKVTGVVDDPTWAALLRVA